MKHLVVNNVFVGGYGHNKGNLPHEMINFFKDGNDNFYIYITPYGVLDKKYKASEIEGILFVRSVGDSIVEVLAKAVVSEKEEWFFTQGVELHGKCEDEDESYTIKKGKDSYENKLNENGKIEYGGKSLSEIHHGNIKDNEIFVSMRVKEICLPNKTFYLTNNKGKAVRSNIKFIGDKKIANQSMKAYYPEEINGTPNISYNELKEVFDGNETFEWKSYVDTPRYDKKDIFVDNNFFKATRQQDNEVMFSNMFYYYFTNYHKLTKSFLEKVCNITISDDFIVDREKDRMDIRIIDDKNYIIFENKIKSSINGMHTKAEDEKKNAKKDEQNKTNYRYDNEDFRIDDNGKYISQLSVYYQKAEEQNNNEKEREIKGFVLAPEYNPFGKNELNKYSCGEHYEYISYKKIHDFFDKNKDLADKDKYIDDFINAMYKHTTSTDNEHRNELLQRLKYRIENSN